MRRLTLVLLLFLGVQVASAEVSTITIDVTANTVTPENPTVNSLFTDSVLLRIVSRGSRVPFPKRTSVYMDSPGRARPVTSSNINGPAEYRFSADTPAIVGDTALIVLKRCGGSETHLIDETGKSMTVPCPSYVLEPKENDPPRKWTVFMDEGTVMIDAYSCVPKPTQGKSKPESPETSRATAETEPGDDTTGAPTGACRTGEQLEEYAFPIQIVERKYGLIWSAGISFIGVRDQEYRLDPIDGDTQNLAVVHNGDGPVPYRLAAFAHYPTLDRQLRSWAFAVGVATSVPVDQLTVMGGFSLTARTLPLTDSGHVIIGMAYAPRKELLTEYRGRPTVPVGTAPASLTTSRYFWGPFIAVSFSFFGGEQQFKGVFSGKPAEEKKKTGS